jgi:hypothetical protein
MFVTVKINAEIERGTLVCHDANNVWRAATSADNAPLGVLSRETTVDDQGVRWGEVTLAGATWARAGASIPDQGGWLAVDDQGRAIVGPAEDCGLIAPLSRGAAAPSVDDLILVYVR